MATTLHTEVFTVQAMHWVNIYNPSHFKNFNQQSGDTKLELYGVSLRKSEVPSPLREIAEDLSTGSLSEEFFSFRSTGVPPIVVCDRDLITVLACADAARISRDWLLENIPADVCIEFIEFESRGYGRHRSGEMVKKIIVKAVRVRLEDVNKRYDDLCAQYFTGG